MTPLQPGCENLQPSDPCEPTKVFVPDLFQYKCSCTALGVAGFNHPDLCAGILSSSVRLRRLFALLILLLLWTRTTSKRLIKIKTFGLFIKGLDTAGRVPAYVPYPLNSGGRRLAVHGDFLLKFSVNLSASVTQPPPVAL